MISTDIEDDEIEKRADNQAYNWMVDDKYYEGIKNNKNYDIEKEEKHPKSFIVYRLAIDKKIAFSSNEHQKFNIIIN